MKKQKKGVKKAKKKSEKAKKKNEKMCEGGVFAHFRLYKHLLRCKFVVNKKDLINNIFVIM